MYYCLLLYRVRTGVPNLLMPVPQNTTWRHSNSPLAFIGEILKFKDFMLSLILIKSCPPVPPRPLLSTGTFNIINKIHSC